MILPGSSSTGATTSAKPGVNGAAGHAVEFGRGRVLHEDHPRFLLDGPEAQRAVGAHAREDDADALLLPVIGQGAEEEINRQAQARGAPPGRAGAAPRAGWTCPCSAGSHRRSPAGPGCGP